MIYVAIDPGITCGFVMVDILNKKRYMKGLKFWPCIEWISVCYENSKQNGQELKVFIEDPNYNKPVFIKRGVSLEKVLNYQKIAQNVGMNKMIATLIIDFCKTKGITVEALKPNPKGKMKAEQFEKHTGIKTNQHVRDAYMILFHKRIIQFSKQIFWNIS